MNLKILNRREKLILGTTLAVFIFSITFNFLIAPVFSKNDLLNKEINFTRVKLKKYQRLLAQKDKIKDKYSKFLGVNNDIKEPNDVASGILPELERLAKDANIRIIEIRPIELDKKLDRYKETVVDLRAQGGMEDYLKFIYNIERSPLLLKIKRFQLTARPSTPALEGSFSISQLLVL